MSFILSTLMLITMGAPATPLYTKSSTPYGIPCYKYTIQSKQHTICWTIDDHPRKNTLQLLQLLRARKLKATFFIVSDMLRYYAKAHTTSTTRYYRAFMKVYTDGHTLGNHSVTHRIICSLPYKEVYWELNTTQKLIKRYSGVTPTLFRPPHALRCWKQRKAARALKLRTVMYHISDYRRSANHMWRKLRWRVRRNKPYTIILIHHKLKRFRQLLRYIDRNP